MLFPALLTALLIELSDDSRARSQELQGRLGIRRTPRNHRSPMQRRIDWAEENLGPRAVALARYFVRSSPGYTERGSALGTAADGVLFVWLARHLHDRLSSGAPLLPGLQITQRHELADALITVLDETQGWDGDAEDVIRRAREDTEDFLKNREEYLPDAERAATALPEEMRTISIDGVVASIKDDALPSKDDAPRISFHSPPLALIHTRPRLPWRLSLSDDQLNELLVEETEGWRAAGLSEKLLVVVKGGMAIDDALAILSHYKSQSERSVGARHPYLSGDSDAPGMTLAQQAAAAILDVAEMRLAVDHTYHVDYMFQHGWAHLVDEHRAAPLNLAAVTPERALLDMKLRHEELARDRVRQDRSGLPVELAEGVDYRVVTTFKDGAAIWELLSVDALRLESQQMSHCIGQEGHGHPERLRHGLIRVFSYRDDSGRARATLEVMNTRSPEPGSTSYPTIDLQGPHNGALRAPGAVPRMAGLLVALRADDSRNDPSTIDSALGRFSLSTFGPRDRLRLEIGGAPREAEEGEVARWVRMAAGDSVGGWSL